MVQLALSRPAAMLIESEELLALSDATRYGDWHESRFLGDSSHEGSAAADTPAVNTAHLHTEHHSHENLGRHVAAGALARTIAQAVIHPLDTIKTRVMVSSPVPQLAEWQMAFNASCTRVNALGLSLQLRNPLCIGGLRDLYRGLAGALATTLPAALVFFSADAAVKSFLTRGKTNKDSCTRHNLGIQMVSACTAACVSALVRVPGDILKHRVQAYIYPNVVQAAKHVWHTKGLHGLYCGFSATLMRDMPEMAIQFTLYEALRNAFNGKSDESGAGNKPKGPNSLVLGAVAGAVASGITTPLDVIKCQMQCQQAVCSASSAVSAILQRRGMAGFVAGLGPRVLQNAMMSAVFFTLYEHVKSNAAVLQRQWTLRGAALSADSPREYMEVAWKMTRSCAGLLSVAQPLQLQHA